MLLLRLLCPVALLFLLCSAGCGGNEAEESIATTQTNPSRNPPSAPVSEEADTGEADTGEAANRPLESNGEATTKTTGEPSFETTADSGSPTPGEPEGASPGESHVEVPTIPSSSVDSTPPPSTDAEVPGNGEMQPNEKPPVVSPGQPAVESNGTAGVESPVPLPESAGTPSESTVESKPAVEPSTVPGTQLRNMGGTNGLGIQIYRELAKTNQEQNVILSPFSIANVVAPLTWAARGSTRQELLQCLGMEENKLESVLKERADERSALLATNDAEPQLEQNGFLGVSGQRVEQGLQITEVRDGSLAERLGLHPTDILANAADFVASKGASDLEVIRGEDLVSPTPSGTVRIGTALWTAPEIQVNAKYTADLKRFFRATCAEVDFTDPQAASVPINRWVDELTDGQIPRIVNADDLQQASFVLANAIHFRGRWKLQFDPKKTLPDAPFHLANGGEVRVPMMTTIGEFPLLSAGGVDHVLLAYDRSEIAMIVSVPREVNGLSKLVNALDANALLGMVQRVSATPPRKLELEIPRTSLTYQTDLKSLLPKFGVTSVFGEDADLTGMTAEKCKVSKILHEARIEMDEEGTKASAATAAVGARFQPQVPLVKADHPFMLTIIDLKTKTVLFLGHVANPRSES